MLRTPKPLILLLAAVAAMGLLGGCGEDDDGNDLGQQAEDAAEDVGEAAQDAFASLRTDGERLIDEIQTRNDPEAKEQLLDRCRDTLEQLREDASASADAVEEVCDLIRDTDVNDRDAWSDVKDRLDQLTP